MSNYVGRKYTDQQDGELLCAHMKTSIGWFHYLCNRMPHSAISLRFSLSLWKEQSHKFFGHSCLIPFSVTLFSMSFHHQHHHYHRKITCSGKNFTKDCALPEGRYGTVTIVCLSIRIEFRQSSAQQEFVDWQRLYAWSPSEPWQIRKEKKGSADMESHWINGNQS